MKRRFQKFIVFALSAVIFTGSFVTAYATESEVSKPTETESRPIPEEETEKQDGEEIAQVILPTSAVDFFDFILDPQELIRQTNAAAYGGKKFEDGATLFFERSDGRTEEDYASDSDAVTITNRGDTPVDVEVMASVTVAMAEDLVMTDDREFTDDTGASLYLALTDAETTVPISLEEGACIQTELPGAEEDSDENKEYAFWLTGACNKKGDWSGLKDMEISVTVTWKVVPRAEEAEPAENEEETLNKENPITSSTVESTDKAATPSEATASDAERNKDETVKATASDADKGKDETEAADDIERGIYATQPTSASDVDKTKNKAVSD